MTRLEADWLAREAVRQVMTLFARAGEEAYFVGGCIRNTLLGVPVTDLDIATPVRPERTLALAAEAGLKAVPTGIDHGTVTVIAEGEPFEITTFRRDVETDGRRAVVAYADRLEEDARRRDFTMNALYADGTGRIHDPLGGLADLEARRVRFIDDANTRIREDYLRILRFFRFHAWYGDDAQGLDPEGLAACARNVEGIGTLSKERIGAEMLKLLSAPAPELALGAMDRSGVLRAVLPGAETKIFFVLAALEPEPEPIRRLASLGEFDVAALLRLRKSLIRRYDYLRRAMAGTENLCEIAYREGADLARSVALLRAALFGQPLAPDLEARLERAEGEIFPVSAKDLTPKFTGPALGERLRRLEKAWIDSGFSLDRAALLQRADEDGDDET
ncbi:CCA tRNA nucleotidyltransferase [Celeribacter indicus]|uniref:tRNA-nucleotidyltransferase n=1 Tax=Celeribacter indicus TaxID=1208324 RepID=A0A0B5DXH2_9RHOB|nr:CCA tRNA nucleotidyltransferase [Celeribacter indicus]AJE44957.1 tRNA-nucleotidyltransferase [Celeribacter indicus]SDW96286.1 poly(A) polymerase [Celeribacter indicus]